MSKPVNCRKKFELIKNSIIKDMSDPFYLSAAPGLAYYFLLSIAPITLALSYLAGFLFTGSSYLTSVIKEYLPGEIADIILSAVTPNSSAAGLVSTIVFFIFTLYLASRGLYTLIKIADYASGSLEASNIKEVPKNFLRRHLKAIILTLLLILIINIALVVMVFGKVGLDMAVSFIDMSSISRLLYGLYHILSYPLAIALIFMILVLLYARMPTERLRFREAVPGAAVAALGLVAASLGFEFYLNYFFKSNAIYGALSGIIVLILWFFLISNVLVFGIVVNHAFKINTKK